MERLIVLGSEQVGKSTLLEAFRRIAGEIPLKDALLVAPDPTTGTNLLDLHVIRQDAHIIGIELWGKIDYAMLSAGMWTNHSQERTTILFVYDLLRPDTFADIRRVWYPGAKLPDAPPRPRIFIVGAKRDAVQGQLPPLDAEQAYANQIGAAEILIVSVYDHSSLYTAFKTIFPTHA